MNIREYVLSEQNIYHAIYSVRSYLEEPELLSCADKELLNSLADPFDSVMIDWMIEKVRKAIEEILDDESRLFKTRVFFKPKGNEGFRPIHTAALADLIAMAAMLHPLVYEIPGEENSWKLNLSNYSRLIPQNFYANKISLKPERLYERWNVQYKKYMQKASGYFRTFHKNGKYKYEVKLDLVDFFPAVDPAVVWGILLEKMPIVFRDEDVATLKTIIYKLLVCKVTNLKTEGAIREYYGDRRVEIVSSESCEDGKNTIYPTKGLPQGLPQAYFFGNLIMTKITDVFEKELPGQSVYYVDDAYIYTNADIPDRQSFEDILGRINGEIFKVTSAYSDKGSSVARDSEVYGPHLSEQRDGNQGQCRIEVHTCEGKSSCTKIRDVEDGELYLHDLSREASHIGADVWSGYSEEEDSSVLQRTEALLKATESELQEKGKREERPNYAEKLEKYNKFLKYRVIRLRLKNRLHIDEEIFKALLGSNYDENGESSLESLKKGINEEDFRRNYKTDIWETALGLLISNTVSGQDQIREYIRSVIAEVYGNELGECSYIGEKFRDFLNGEEVRNSPDCYAYLDRMTRRKLARYAQMNQDTLKKEFEGSRLKGLQEDILTSFGICTEGFRDMCSIVDANSDRLRRMFLNAVYSRIFKVRLSDDMVMGSYDRAGITYGALRALAFLRNSECSTTEFLNWGIDLADADNMRAADYLIFRVLAAYRRYVSVPKRIDDLIQVHKYTCDVWKNGARHLYFYTLHNQEHAVDLVMNIIKIVKVFSCFDISKYDYYLLFTACYLHDIAMVRIASEDDFLLGGPETDNIAASLESNWKSAQNKGCGKKAMVGTYKEIDDFFERKIRSEHAKNSADEIRSRHELDFLDPSAREHVAQISESHMLDTDQIYSAPDGSGDQEGAGEGELIRCDLDKILLRFADLLDMSRGRVSKVILNHNLDLIPDVSAFHWVSHLLTKGYTLTSRYDKDMKSQGSALKPGGITETVTLSVFVSLSQFSKMKNAGCEYGEIDEDTISNRGFDIRLLKENEKCTSTKCNFLCRWFNTKNKYLIKEMQALEKYLKGIPPEKRFYDTEIIIKVVVTDSTNLPDECFEVLKKQVK